MLESMTLPPIDRKCAGCGAPTPAAGRSERMDHFGWRLHRCVLASGVDVLEWRCLACWTVFKQEQIALGVPSPSSTVVVDAPEMRHEPE
jgi:hypothetical protein